MGFRPKINSERCRKWFGFAKKKILTLKKREIVKKVYDIDGYRILVKPTTNKAIISAPPGLFIIRPGEEYLEQYYADQYAEVASKPKEISPLATTGANKHPITLYNVAWSGAIVALPQIPDYINLYISALIKEIPTGYDEAGEVESITVNGAGVLFFGDAVLASYKLGVYRGFVSNIGKLKLLGSVVHAEGFSISMFSANVVDGTADTSINYVQTLHGVMWPYDLYVKLHPPAGLFPVVYDIEDNERIWTENSRFIYPALWSYIDGITSKSAVRFMHLMYSRERFGAFPTRPHTCFLFGKIAPTEVTRYGIYDQIRYSTAIYLDTFVHLLFTEDVNYEDYPTFLNGQGSQNNFHVRTIYIPIASDTLLLAHFIDSATRFEGAPGAAYVSLKADGTVLDASSLYVLPYVWQERVFPHCSCCDDLTLADSSCYLYWEDQIVPDWVTVPPPIGYASKWVNISKLAYGKPLIAYAWHEYDTLITHDSKEYQLISFTPIEVSFARRLLFGVFYVEEDGSYFGVLDSAKEDAWRIGQKISSKRLDRAEAIIFGEHPQAALFKQYRGMRNFWSDAYYSGIGDP